MDHKLFGAITRRGFLKTGLYSLVGVSANYLFKNTKLWNGLISKQKRIYIANDDHTDYMWTVDEATSQQAFIDMLDYYLDLADQTSNKPPENQSRFNVDGNFWIWTYEKNKSQKEFDRLIERIKDGHINIPLQPLNLLYGAMPAEAVIRSMFYAGTLERRFNIRIPLISSLENQTLPYGVGALWSGSGARYSWKGVCGCASKIKDLRSRKHEIYWFTGPDGSRVLMKWYSLLKDSKGVGGYAEARDPSAAIEFVDKENNFLSKYPYDVIGIFGRGWDDVEILTDEFVKISETKTTDLQKIFVSNEIDFFRDFESTYGSSLPQLSESFGNEWDPYTASLSEVTARVRRSTEKLRGAEAIASVVGLRKRSKPDGSLNAREKAWLNLGLYYEHDWTADGPISGAKRQEWQRKLAGEFEDFVETLQNDAVIAFGGLIRKAGGNQRFFVFNPLNWVRTDYADFPYNNMDPFHVIDLTTGAETPSQIVEIDGLRKLRILAQNVPSVGYKVFEIQSGSGAFFPDAASIKNNVIENGFCRLTIAPRGAITSLIDKSHKNRELVSEINGRVFNDLGPGSGNLELENIGPVSCTILARSDKPLTHNTRITVFTDMDRIEIRNEITQNFWSIFTWGFGFNLESPDVWHEEVGAIALAKLTSQGGHYATQNARYDWLTLNHFADISNDLAGITLSSADCSFMQLGNSTPDKLDSNSPLISVLAGGQTDGMKLGIQGQGGDTYFLQRFAIKAHEKYDPASAMRFSMEHQNPFLTGEVTGETGWSETSGTSIVIDNPNVFLLAFKPAEDGSDSGFAIRLWNLSPEVSNFSLEMPQLEIKNVIKSTHIETPTGPAGLSAGKLVEFLKPWQMQTYMIQIGGKRPSGLLRQVKLK